MIRAGGRRGVGLALLLATSACARCGSSQEAALEPSALDASQAAATAPREAADAADLVSTASARDDAGGEWAADANGKVEGAIDAAALRAKHRPRLHAAAPVTVLRGGSARELGERICQASVPARPAETPVLLKPNLGGFDWFKDPKKNGGDDGVRGRITDPEFVRGVIRCLRARGHTKITVAEGWGATHADWERLIDVSGYKKMAAEEHVPLVAMDDDGVFDVEGDRPGKPVGLTGMEKTSVPTLLIPKILAEHLDHGLFVSLPKVKAHRFGVFSMAIKGMQGTVMLSDKAPFFKQKWRMHRELNPWLEAKKHGTETREAYVAALETFAERIVDVLEVETPDVVLAEGAPAMSGDGFQKLVPSAESFAIGGENPILVDRVGAELLGLWDRPELARELQGHRTSPLLEAAAKREEVDLRSPAVVGDGAELLASPRPTNFVAMAGFTLSSEGAPKAAAESGDAASSAVNPVNPGDAAPAAPAASASASASASANAHAVPGTATIDGKGNDAIWQRAPAVSFETDYAGRATGVTTTVRFAWSKEALYALFDLKSAGLHTDTSRPIDVERDRLYDEDCVEIFLAPNPQNPRRYFEVEVGPYGHFLDLFIDREKKKSDVSWSGQLRVATTRDPSARTAVIEVAMTAPDVIAALTAGAHLPLGIFRMEGKDPRLYLAFSPARTKSPNFHIPEAFGTLVLDP